MESGRSDTSAGRARKALPADTNPSKDKKFYVHPHSDQSGTIVLVHNGIIENYQVEKERLIADGHQFFSQTDSEVLAHLVGEAFVN